MRRIVAGLVVVCACGGPDYDLRITASMTVTPVSGTGTSPLEPLVGQSISFDVTFAKADRAYDPVNGCPTTTYGESMPPKQATGATAALVQPEVLDRLPYWEAVLSACMPTSGSSVTLRSDNQAGLAVTVGCRDLAPSLTVLDGSGHPRWTTFVEMASCDVTLYDQLNGRLYGGSAIAMQIDAP